MKRGAASKSSPAAESAAELVLSGHQDWRMEEDRRRLEFLDNPKDVGEDDVWIHFFTSYKRLKEYT